MYVIEHYSPNAVSSGKSFSDFYSRWPETLPAPPQDSIIYQASSYGKNVFESIFGKPITDQMEDVGWNVLENFGKVTKIAKESTASALEHPMAKPFIPLIPASVYEYLPKSKEAKELASEYEPAANYLYRYKDAFASRESISHQKEDTHSNIFTALQEIVTSKSAQTINIPLVSPEEWISWRNKTGMLEISGKSVCKIIIQRGVNSDIRSDVWKFLLGVYPWDSTESERVTILKEKTESYKSMKSQWKIILAEFIASNPDGANSFEITEPSQAWDDSDKNDAVSKIRERINRIMKDVIRTDRDLIYFGGTEDGNPSPLSSSPDGAISLPHSLQMLKDILMTYTMYNFDLGYVQGMNDLLSPILLTMNSESVAFWGFVNYMESVKGNFSKDQVGMQEQLNYLKYVLKFMDPTMYEQMVEADSDNMFCSFRMLLIRFKREFSMQDILILWERLWASEYVYMHIFFAYSLLNAQRLRILSRGAFDEILKLVNTMALNHNIQDSLCRMNVIFDNFKRRLKRIAKERLQLDLDIEVDAEYEITEWEMMDTDCNDAELIEMVKLLEKTPQ